MRGVKIGKKKGGEKISVMSIFEKKKTPTETWNLHIFNIDSLN